MSLPCGKGQNPLSSFHQSINLEMEVWRDAFQIKIKVVGIILKLKPVVKKQESRVQTDELDYTLVSAGED